MLHIHRAIDIAIVRELFREYAAGLGVDLGFQDFEKELATLPGDYDPILVAHWNGVVAGCAALHPIDSIICEMKRLYVRLAYRGHSIGRTLAERMMAEGREKGFQRMRLDTLPMMAEAQKLYRSLGFIEIPPYRFNPVPGSKFMEVQL